MPLGFINSTQAINMTDVNAIVNVTSYSGFIVNVNNTLFLGWLFFILLCLLGGVIMLSAILRQEDPLPIVLGTSFICAVIGLFMRAAQLMNDKQAWVFPILTVCLLALSYITKNQ